VSYKSKLRPTFLNQVRETVTARWQHCLVLLWHATIGMRMTVKTGQPLQNGVAPQYVYHHRTAWCCVVFVGKRYGSKGYPQRNAAQCTVNIACHVKQSSKTTSFGGTLSWRWRGWKSSVRVVPTATTRVLRHRFPGTCEMVGQVFKFVWRLRWKINVVCMSLSPFVSFQLRFVTYLLIFPGTYHYALSTKHYISLKMRSKIL